MSCSGEIGTRRGSPAPLHALVWKNGSLLIAAKGKQKVVIAREEVALSSGLGIWCLSGWTFNLGRKGNLRYARQQKEGDILCSYPAGGKFGGCSATIEQRGDTFGNLD